MTQLCSLIRRLTLTALCAGAFAAGQPAFADGTVLVTGANRGIGLEYVRQYAAKGFTVIATARTPARAEELNALAQANPKIKVEALDVTDLAAIDALAAKYKGTAIDVLINNAGITGDTAKQRFGSIDYADFDAVMRTNVQGPLKMTEAFVAHVAASPTRKVVVVTSSEGSIAGATSSRQPFYRASKAAVNMVMRNVAHAVKDRGIVVVLVNPGPVDTDMMAAARGRMPLRTPTLAVTEMMAVTDRATPADSGKFFNFDGTELPW
jgi:NAD(P)-dependent dehydrogenase (short-subunit alcohol dehydrogenase family)